MQFLKGFASFIPLFISLMPLFLILALVFLLLFMFKNKVKIKLRTFKGKGFRPVRGNFGLYCYCGKQGEGKTYSMVEYMLDNKDKICVYCNISGIQGIDYKLFTGFKELIQIKEQLDADTLEYDKTKQLVIVYDEVFTEIMKGDRLSKPVLDFLCQMRKRKIIFLTTCQEWPELPLTYRRFCRYQIDCKMIPFLWTGFLIKTFKDGENMKWSNEEQEHVAPIVETTITKCRASIANSYDTFLRISSVQAPPIADATRQQTGVRDDILPVKSLSIEREIPEMTPSVSEDMSRNAIDKGSHK